jgi:hypothetical protein
LTTALFFLATLFGTFLKWAFVTRRPCSKAGVFHLQPRVVYALLNIVYIGLVSAKPCAPDHEDDRVVRLFIQHVGVQGWAVIVGFIGLWYGMRFEDTAAGRTLSRNLEAIKSAQRTRAEGWAAWCRALEMMRSASYRDAFHMPLTAFMAYYDSFIRSNRIDPDFWDAPQLLRSIAKRIGLCWLLPVL